MNAEGPFRVITRLALITVLMISSAGCGHKEPAKAPVHTEPAETPANTKPAETPSNTKLAETPSNTESEVTIDFSLETKEIVLTNLRLKECVYTQLGKEDGAPLYEEELEAYRGLLHEPDYGSFTISSGQELDFVRSYFNLDSFDSFQVAFTPELHDWTALQLEGLRDLQKPVRILSTKDTVPAKVLAFFTGTDELIFDNITDVTGTLTPGSIFSETVKDVSILSYQIDTPCTYENLFACMEDSNVAHLSIPRSGHSPDSPFFLDGAARMRSLVSLDLSRRRIRVENKECLSKSSLQYLTNFILDGETDTSIFQTLPQLNRIVCDVTSDADLSFLFETKTLSLRLLFCPEIIEFSDNSELYPDGRPVVFPALDDALAWRQSVDDNNFLAIYQRFSDDGRIIECFTIRSISESSDDVHAYSYPIQNERTFLRVTDGERVQLLLPERDNPDLADFGDYRSDYVSLIDINFDGINDITLDTGGFGNSLASYAFGWIYDNDSGTYLISDSFRNIINPFADSEHRLIRSTWRNSAASHGWATYRYDEVTGDYRIERLLTEEDRTYLASEWMPDLQIPDHGTLWGYEETVYAEDGVTVLEKDSYYMLDAPGYHTEYLDASYDFHSPGPYWGFE